MGTFTIYINTSQNPVFRLKLFWISPFHITVGVSCFIMGFGYQFSTICIIFVISIIQEQYETVFEALLELFTIPDTSIAKNEFCKYIADQECKTLPKNQKAYKREFQVRR